MERYPRPAIIGGPVTDQRDPSRVPLTLCLTIVVTQPLGWGITYVAFGANPRAAVTACAEERRLRAMRLGA